MGRRTLMASIAIVTLFVSACGNESVSGQATAPEAAENSATTTAAPTTVAPDDKYVIIPGTYEGDTESLWAEMAGEEIEPIGFVVDVEVDGPLYGPSETAGNFDAMGHVGNKCTAVFVTGMGTGEASSFGTILYVETGDEVVPWAARSSEEANVTGANELIAHFRPQCG